MICLKSVWTPENAEKLLERRFQEERRQVGGGPGRTVGGYLVTEAEERLVFGGREAQAVQDTAKSLDHLGSLGPRPRRGSGRGGAMTHSGMKHNPFGHSRATGAPWL